MALKLNHPSFNCPKISPFGPNQSTHVRSQTFLKASTLGIPPLWVLEFFFFFLVYGLFLILFFGFWSIWVGLFSWMVINVNAWWWFWGFFKGFDLGLCIPYQMLVLCMHYCLSVCIFVCITLHFLLSCFDMNGCMHRYLSVLFKINSCVLAGWLLQFWFSARFVHFPVDLLPSVPVMC